MDDTHLPAVLVRYPDLHGRAEFPPEQEVTPSPSPLKSDKTKQKTMRERHLHYVRCHS